MFPIPFKFLKFRTVLYFCANFFTCNVLDFQNGHLKVQIFQVLYIQSLIQNMHRTRFLKHTFTHFQSVNPSSTFDSVWCLSVWCRLDGCDALISQQDNCIVTVSVYSVCVHTTQPWAQNCPEQSRTFGMSVALHGSPTMAISWPAFFSH